jgi:hypothetical protein
MPSSGRRGFAGGRHTASLCLRYVGDAVQFGSESGANAGCAGSAVIGALWMMSLMKGLEEFTISKLVR